jgi:meiotic recombination protein REC8
MIASTNASSSPDLAQVWRRNRLVIIPFHHLKLLTTPANRSLPRLVATLGSKSNLKKVSRKAILDVDVIKTCDTIIEPAAPMALRLSGNLLYVVSPGSSRIPTNRSTDLHSFRYGITRVYAQQCGYVLGDAEAARNSMLAMFKALKSDGLDAVGGHKGR